jgi:hypothetical protein
MIVFNLDSLISCITFPCIFFPVSNVGIVTIQAGEPFFPVAPEKIATPGLSQRSIALRPFWRLRRVVAALKPSVIHA